MEIDVEVMRTGANRSYTAAAFADEGARSLGRRTVTSGMFGGFDAAGDFEAILADAHTQHVTRLREDERRLGVLGDKAHAAAGAFTEMEQRNTDALREVAWLTTQA